MREEREFRQSQIGSFDVEVYSSGSGRRLRCSRFTLRCDAIALHEKEILLLSAFGSETGVKALVAGLRSSTRDQKHIEYTVHLGDVNEAGLTKSPDGYRVYRTKFNYGLWQVLCLSRCEGLMPLINEEAIWQLLRSDRFTTPVVRDWMPWLRNEMIKTGVIVPLTQSGCEAGLMLASDDTIDELISRGIKEGHLVIPGHGASQNGHRRTISKGGPKNLEDYLLGYGRLLGQQAEKSLHPLHLPGQHPLPLPSLLRTPFEAQAHVIAAASKALSRQKSILLVGEMGTGKTIMGMVAIHSHARSKPYRALVFCPGQLTRKWEREIRDTIPAAEVIHIESWQDLLTLKRTGKPAGIEWYIIARDRAKLGARWKPAYQVRRRLADGFIRCPQCGRRLVDDKRDPLFVGQPGKNGQTGTGLWRRRLFCRWVLSDHHQADAETGKANQLVEGCGSPLWQMTAEIRRYEPALYIKRHLRKVFKYLVLDEIHEEKAADTAQGHAAAALASSCQKVIALTGTLIGGYAEHLRPLLFRLAPNSLVHEGLKWSDATAFSERYGRIETRITERSGGRGEDNRMSRGSKSTIKTVRPGIMPPLFGKHLMDKTIFLTLNEVAHNLPALAEECIPVSMNDELEAAYRVDVQEPLVEAVKDMMKRRDRRLLGAMLQTLLAYPDHPFGWGPVGYHKGDEFITVATPPNLPDDVIRPKEQTLIDLLQSERNCGRQVWVYVQFTNKHDVESRLDRILRDHGFRVGVLRSSIPLGKREEWIARNAPQVDVMISHPRLVETGMDLFDKHGRHNFSTICFYQTGYNLFTLRQASRRSWRIGQTRDCRVVYLYYRGTMQDRALALIGKKLTAAQALEGQFSSEGLVTMAGDDANLEIALARSLVNRMDEGDAGRHWRKTVNPKRQTITRILPGQSIVGQQPSVQLSLFDFLETTLNELSMDENAAALVPTGG